MGDLEMVDVEDSWSSDYDILMKNDVKKTADRGTEKLFSNSEWTYYYLRTVEMLKNIFELADLNRFCTDTDRSIDLNQGIILIAKMHTGDLFSTEGRKTQSSDFKKLMTSSRVAAPLSEETINT